MKRIGIMGGTFDPVHNGHLLLGRQARSEYGLDEIWYMHVPQEIRMERLRSSRGYSDEKMYAVFANQPSEETFTAVSDLVIENGGTFEETEKQIDLALGRG